MGKKRRKRGIFTTTLQECPQGCLPVPSFRSHIISTERERESIERLGTKVMANRMESKCRGIHAGPLLCHAPPDVQRLSAEMREREKLRAWTVPTAADNHVAARIGQQHFFLVRTATTLTRDTHTTPCLGMYLSSTTVSYLM